MSAKKYFNSDSEGEDSLEEESILFPKKKQQPVESDNDDEERLLAESDSDDAPDDVAFTESRKSTLDNVRKTLAQIRSTKQEQKEKRKDKDALYKQQKIDALNKNRLSEEFLRELNDEPSPPKKSKTVVQNDDKVSDSDNFKLVDELRASDDNSGDSEGDDGFGSEEEFIPLNKPDSGIEAVALPGFVREQPKSLVERAKQFRDRALNNVKVPRASAQDLLNNKKKRAAKRH